MQSLQQRLLPRAIGLNVWDGLHDLQKLRDVLPTFEPVHGDMQVTPITGSIEKAHREDFKLIGAVRASRCTVLGVSGLLQLDSVQILSPILVGRTDVLALQPQACTVEAESKIGLAVPIGPSQIRNTTLLLQSLEIKIQKILR